MKSFEDQVVVIVGATGGLGSAYARAFAADGARLALVARDASALAVLAAQLDGAAVFSADITHADALDALRDAVLTQFGRVDIVINATGIDVRKPLVNHSENEIRRSLDVNLLGAILLTRAFIPAMRAQRSGMIVHMGGFADGRLAFPYYSADVATRAGLFSFVESINRELAGSGVVVQFFSPSPADTAAERPYHAMWKAMQIEVEPVDRIAHALLRAVAKRQRVAIMGGFVTRFFARLNSVFPRIADVIMLNKYRHILAQYLAPDEQKQSPASNSSLRNRLGIFLIVLSFVLYGGLLAAPFVPLSDVGKLALSGVLVASGEATFWVGGFLVGAGVIARYRKYMNPCEWVCWRAAA